VPRRTLATQRWQKDDKDALVPAPRAATAASEEESNPLAAICVIVSAVLGNITIGVLFTWTFFVAPLEVATGLARATLSLTFSAATASFATTMFLGVGVHAKYPTPIVTAAALLTGGFGIAMAGTLKTFPALIVGFGVLFGITNGIIYGISLSAANQMGSGKYAAVAKGLATGACVGGYTMTPIFFGAPVKALLNSLGPHAALVTLGGIVAGVAIPMFTLYQVGKLQIPVPTIADVDPAAAEIEAKRVKLLQITIFFSSVAPLMCIAHAAGIYASLGGAAANAVGVLSTMSICNWAARIICGAMCDQPNGARLGLRIAAITTTAALGAILGLGSAMGPIGVAAALCVIGYGYGSLMTCMPGITTKLVGASRFGACYGKIFGLGWGIAGISSAYIAGMVYDATGTYLASVAIAIVLSTCYTALSFHLPDEPER